MEGEFEFEDPNLERDLKTIVALMNRFLTNLFRFLMKQDASATVSTCFRIMKAKLSHLGDGNGLPTKAWGELLAEHKAKFLTSDVKEDPYSYFATLAYNISEDAEVEDEDGEITIEKTFKAKKVGKDKRTVIQVTPTGYSLFLHHLFDDEVDEDEDAVSSSDDEGEDDALYERFAQPSKRSQPKSPSASKAPQTQTTGPSTSAPTQTAEDQSHALRSSSVAPPPQTSASPPHQSGTSAPPPGPAPSSVSHTSQSTGAHLSSAGPSSSSGQTSAGARLRVKKLR